MSFNYTQQVHLISLQEPVNISKRFGDLPAGKWLLHDLNAFELAQKARRGTAKVCDNWRGDSPEGPAYFGSSTGPILIMRQGAWGDLLLLTPVFAQMKSRPAICCWPSHFALFNGNTDVAGLVEYPLSADKMESYSDIVSLENTMESDHSQHATDVFAKALGLQTPLADYKPVYRVTDEEKEATKKHLFSNRPNIVIQQRASVANRDYPLEQWLEVIVKLEQRGWGVLLVGHKGQLPNIPRQHQSPFIRDLSRLDLPFRETAAVLAQAQAFCGVDSAWAHMCHALDIPAVVLFGPFHWGTRTSKAPKTIAIQGSGPCAPCNWHMHAGRMFPPDKPCTAIQKCVVLASIPPSRILAKIDLLKP